MNIPTEIIKLITCSIAKDGHFIEDGVIMDCGCCVCKDCLNMVVNDEFKCIKCDTINNKKKVKRNPENKLVNTIIDSYMTQIVKIIKDDAKESLETIKIDNLKSLIDLEISRVRTEIENRVEHAKNELDNLKRLFSIRLDFLKDNYKEHINDESLLDVKEKLQREIEINSENFHKIQKNVKFMIYEVKEFVKSFKLNFIVNNDNIEKTLIGQLKEQSHFNFSNFKINNIKRKSSDEIEFMYLPDCSVCKTRNIKEAFKCLICENYSLCSECFENYETKDSHETNHQRRHPVIKCCSGKIFNQEIDYDKINMTNIKKIFENCTHNFICDGCEAYSIQGVRFRCSECENYDLCYECFNDSIETGNHKKNHSLIVSSRLRSRLSISNIND